MTTYPPHHQFSWRFNTQKELTRPCIHYLGPCFLTFTKSRRAYCGVPNYRELQNWDCLMRIGNTQPTYMYAPTYKAPYIMYLYRISHIYTSRTSPTYPPRNYLTARFLFGGTGRRYVTYPKRGWAFFEKGGHYYLPTELSANFYLLFFTFYWERGALSKRYPEILKEKNK